MFRILLVATLVSVSLTATAKDYVVEVHGIVCEFCSLGVAKNVGKLPFVDQAAPNKGVRVEINNQLVYVSVKDEASLDKAALFKAIESGGYSPVNVWEVNAGGQLGELVQ